MALNPPGNISTIFGDENYLNNSYAFDFTFKIFGAVVLVLGLFLLILLNSLIFYIFKRLNCCKNDSLCEFLNRDFKKEEIKKKIFTIDFERINHNGYFSEDSLKTRLYHKKENEPAIDYYGIKTEESDDNIEQPKNPSQKFNFNTNSVMLKSFRTENFSPRNNHDTRYTGCLDMYNSLLINPNNDLLENQLNELDNLEKHLSKSLSELNELQRKLCLENSLVNSKVEESEEKAIHENYELINEDLKSNENFELKESNDNDHTSNDEDSEEME
ncbi:unnamed protein product [Brachionus calyciflorus]|uniref:Uncharacterized protein n=1 Tax=Brachionus calyciflorus TaxID=104777 RepID=A0A814BZZ6_9BILA|nr:unnamed protein product [Brachionus calyciflorus]